jgi:hypothetical protein
MHDHLGATETARLVSLWKSQSFERAWLQPCRKNFPKWLGFNR